MKEKLFCFYDNVAKSPITFASSPNCPTLIRQYLQYIASSKPLKDITIYEVAEIEGFEVKPISPVVHSWDEYKFPENKAEALAPLGASVTEIEKAFAEKTADVKD